MYKSNSNNQHGMALVAAVMILAALVLIMVALGTRVSTHHSQVNIYGDFKETFNGLETGLAESIAQLLTGQSGSVGVSGWTGTAIPEFGDAGVTPLTIPGTQIEYFAYVQDWSNNGKDDLLDGSVDGSSEASMKSIHVAARKNGIVRKGYAIIGDAGGGGLSDNVISGGSGNVHVDSTPFKLRVYGPVHILGDSLADSDIALNMNNGSFIHDGYNSVKPVPGNIQDRIPLLLPLDAAGVETMKATLRVKQGIVALGGGDIGAKKNPMSGVYLDDGYTNSGGSLKIFSDTGINGYEATTKFAFPLYCGTAGNPGLMEEFLVGYGSANDPNTDYVAVNGFSLGEENFYYNASTSTGNTDWVKNVPLGTGAMPHYDELEALIAQDDFFVWFDKAERQMVINGRIAVIGDLTLGDPTPKKKKKNTIYYHGNGTFMTFDPANCEVSDPGDLPGTPPRDQIIIKSGLVPRSIVFPVVDKTDPQFGDPLNVNFPDKNSLGIMSRSTLTFEVDKSQQDKNYSDVYGAFYSQDLVVVKDKGNPTTFVGTVAGSRFEVYDQTTWVFVPTLSANLPRGWPGGGAGIPTKIAWYEVGVD